MPQENIQIGLENRKFDYAIGTFLTWCMVNGHLTKTVLQMHK